MHAQKLNIRKARPEDCQDVLIWRNDPRSMVMFMNARLIQVSEHQDWYFGSLANENIYMYIAEVSARAIGICRFEIDDRKTIATIAINLDSKYRGKGLGLDLLTRSCEIFLTKHPVPLMAKVKPENGPSVKMFLSAGFQKTADTNGVLNLVKNPNKIFFKSVDVSDASLLYGLLQKRKCNISHREMPSYRSHHKFVCSAPYLHWYVVYDLAPVGSFYLKSDNSVGLNLLVPDQRYIAAVLNFISRELTPVEPVPSLVPENYFINVAYENHEMRRALIECGLNPIQVSYELGGKVNDV